jgi:alpha-beta hydrolase superfamily lysophospholipase
MRPPRRPRRARRVGLAAALTVAPVALAYRFALAYRARAGIPRPRPPTVTPTDLGLDFDDLLVDAPEARLRAWFIPARERAPGPGVLLIHGWESGRDRTLPLAKVLHDVGFHCLTIDVRGMGANPPERLPVSAGEFGLDALAGFGALIDRPEVTVGAIHGHSMGGVGALLAAAADPRVAGVVAVSTPADPYRLTRQTFRLARLPFPDPVAYPLAWLTTRVFVRPRGHVIREISAAGALARFTGPVLLAHGDADAVIPISHLRRLIRARRRTRLPLETLVIGGGHHSWLYEFPSYRRAVAAFLAAALGGPVAPERAAEIAAAVKATRLPEGEAGFSAMEDEPGGVRTFARAVAVGGPRHPVAGAAGKE